jgi:hypothetical protein
VKAGGKQTVNRLYGAISQNMVLYSKPVGKSDILIKVDIDIENSIMECVVI